MSHRRNALDQERWRRIDELFHAIVDLDGKDRQSLLERHCGADESLRSEVESLLAAHVKPREREREFDHPLILGGFTIKSVLGQGGMGVVYEAEQDNPRRIVALKVMRRFPWLDDVAAQLFAREIQALARLQHPGIAAIYSAGATEEGWYYFAMERVIGSELIAHAARFGLSIRDKLHLFSRICDAVQYAHQRGVIHRDLKPSNVMVPLVRDADHDEESPDDSAEQHRPADCVPKILDFGLAKLLDMDAGQTRLTMSGTFRGTLAYASPEQVRDFGGEVDVRSDVYSLGVILYELLTGRLPVPIRDRQLADAIRLVQEHEPEPIGRLDRSLRGDVETILSKALAKERANRYQSAGALADDLRNFLAGKPIEARPAQLGYLLRKWLSRNYVAAITYSLGFALIVACSSILLQQAWSREEIDRRERVAILQSAKSRREDLDLVGSAAANAAREVWRRIESGDASEAEIDALAGASFEFEYAESRIYDVLSHTEEDGTLVFHYSTSVYGCPDGLGFKFEPQFIVDGIPVAKVGGIPRSETRRLSSAILLPPVPVGLHTINVRLNLTPYSRVIHVDGSRERVAIASPVTLTAPTFEFAAVSGHPSDYPTMIPIPPYQETFSAEFRVESACLSQEGAQPRQTPPKDILRVAVSFPPPPLELALEISIRGGQGFHTSTEMFVLPSSGDHPPVLVYNNIRDEARIEGDRFLAVARIPVAVILCSANPETLVNLPLWVECTSTRVAARNARFERFLDVAGSGSTLVGDDRPDLYRQAGAVAYPLLAEFSSAAEISKQLNSLTLLPAAGAIATDLVQHYCTPDMLQYQAWLVASTPGATATEYARALARAQEAARQDGGDHAIQHSLGAALYRVGKYGPAISALSRSLELSERNKASKLSFLAMAYYRAGRLEESAAAAASVDSLPSISAESRAIVTEARELLQRVR
ncbi:MAG: hypothetical protein AMXMBFR47_39200 [Planctomycetota bacterium]